MCLEIIHTFTFTTYDALQRLVDELKNEEYQNKVGPKGYIIYITNLNGFDYDETKYTFDELFNSYLFYNQFEAKFIEVNGWNEFFNTSSKFSKCDIIFGKFSIKMR